jgi:hypothetical protein
MNAASLSGAVELQTKPQSKQAKASSDNSVPPASVKVNALSPCGRNMAEA